MALAWLLASLVLTVTGGVLTPLQAEGVVQTYTTTSRLNVRSGPATTSAILGTLSLGDTVQATGTAVDGWLPIRYDGRTAYVSATYVKEADAAQPAPLVSGPASTKVTTVNVNARTGASLDAEIVTVMAKGTQVQCTGRTSGDFSEITLDGTIRWAYSRYLGDEPAATSPGSTVTSPGSTVESPAVVTTGSGAPAGSASSSGAALSSTTGSTTTSADLPTAVGVRYVTASAVNIRAGAAVTTAKVTAVPRGTPLQITGVVEGTYTQIIYSGRTRWVATAYLSSTRPTIVTGSLGSVSLDKLNAHGKAVVLDIRANFPQIKTIYGWRSYSAYSSDHPSGRAIDIMIPSYKSNKALGDAVAAYVIANSKRLNVRYLIWRQRNYTISRGYWVSMANRGSDTANHYDHVHVSVFDA